MREKKPEISEDNEVVPNFKIGSEAGMVQDSPVTDQLDHKSILDIDIPDVINGDEIDVSEAPIMMRQESFLTKVEEFSKPEDKGQAELEIQLRKGIVLFSSVKQG